MLRLLFGSIFFDECSKLKIDSFERSERNCSRKSGVNLSDHEEDSTDFSFSESIKRRGESNECEILGSWNDLLNMNYSQLEWHHQERGTFWRISVSSQETNIDISFLSVLATKSTWTKSTRYKLWWITSGRFNVNGDLRERTISFGSNRSRTLLKSIKKWK